MWRTLQRCIRAIQKDLERLHLSFGGHASRRKRLCTQHDVPSVGGRQWLVELLVRKTVLPWKAGGPLTGTDGGGGGATCSSVQAATADRGALRVRDVGEGIGVEQDEVCQRAHLDAPERVRQAEDPRGRIVAARNASSGEKAARGDP